MTAHPPPTPMTDQLAWVRAQEEKTHRQRRVTNWIVVLACLATLAVVGYSHLVLTARLDAAAKRETAVLRIAQQATGPAQQKASVAAVNHLVACIENHDNRVGDQLLGVPVVPLTFGCPDDTLLTRP